MTLRKRQVSGDLTMKHYVNRTLRRACCGSVYGPALSLRNQ